MFVHGAQDLFDVFVFPRLYDSSVSRPSCVSAGMYIGGKTARPRDYT